MVRGIVEALPAAPPRRQWKWIIAAFVGWCILFGMGAVFVTHIVTLRLQLVSDRRIEIRVPIDMKTETFRDDGRLVIRVYDPDEEAPSVVAPLANPPRSSGEIVP